MEAGVFRGAMAQRGLTNHTSMDLILVSGLAGAGVMTASQRVKAGQPVEV